jgi:hypothetical protein
MIHHLIPHRLTRHLTPLLRMGVVAAAASMVACGGGGDDEVPAPGGGTIGFEIIAGGDACGGGGCGGDGSGGGVGGDGGGGGGDGAGGGLGEMRNVRVTARQPDGTKLGSALLQNNLVSIYDRTYKGAFILEFADDGSGNGEYYDEATQSWTRLGGQSLHIVVPRLMHHVSANPLTEAAYQWALNKYGTESALNAARMTEANEAVRAAFNLRVPVQYQISDITNYATAVSDATVANSLPNTHAGRYGTLLAAMPRAARLFFGGLPLPALYFTRELVKDMRDDGIVNASVNDAEPLAYDATLPDLLVQALISARADYGQPAQPLPTDVPSICFNPALFAVGTKWQLDYVDFNTATSPLLSPASGKMVAQGLQGTPSSLSLEVVRTTTFDKYTSALEIKTVADGLTTSFAYTGTDFSQGLVNYGGTEPTDFQGIPLNAVTVIDPASVNRQFLLKVDESETITINGTTTFYNLDSTVFQVGAPQTVRQTTTFVGYEDVTVQGQSYKKSCHYQVDNETTTLDYWYTSGGQGVPVLIVGGGIRSELVSGVVNGQAVK